MIGGIDRKPAEPSPTIKLVLDLLRQHTGKIALVLVTVLFGQVQVQLYPKLVELGMDAAVSGTLTDRLALVLLVSLLGVVVLRLGTVWVQTYLSFVIGKQLVVELRRRIAKRIVRLEPWWFDRVPVGEVVGRMASDADTLSHIAPSVAEGLSAIFQIVLATVLILLIDVRLTAAALSAIPVLVLVALAAGNRANVLASALTTAEASATVQLHQMLSRILTVQAYGREEEEEEHYRARNEESLGATRRFARLHSLTSTVLVGSTSVAVLVVVGLGIRYVADGELTAGSLTAFLMYIVLILQSLNTAANSWVQFQQSVGAVAKLDGYLKAAPNVRGPADPKPLPDGSELAFEDCTVTYPSRPLEPVLVGVSFDVGPGRPLALVGRSGAGKSTIVNAVMRFIDPLHGRVRLNGVDLRELALRDLRRAVALVSQEAELTRGSVRDNIAYGCDDATLEDVQRAAKMAQAHDFIERLPHGYDTILSDSGDDEDGGPPSHEKARLSGGQKQRIALARALASDPRVLILDEPTSQLDAESEAAIRRVIQELSRTRAVLVVAHRLNTIRDVGAICVLEQGQIIEQGTHEELMREGGVYRHLVELASREEDLEKEVTSILQLDAGDDDLASITTSVRGEP